MNREELVQSLLILTDQEKAYNLLRRFKKEEWGKIEQGQSAQGVEMTTLFRQLTDVAEIALEAAFRRSEKDLKEKFSLSPGFFAIVAMGKFGGRELTYGSDLDIIFLFEKPASQEYFIALVQKTISYMSALTTEGYAYKIDTELRPSGRSGLLVSSFPSFQEYHAKEAELWEQQALIKARPVIGDLSFQKEVGHFIHGIAYRKRDPSIADEINRLRKRMELEIGQETKGRIHLKTGRGGIVDIEFMIQFLQLLHGGDDPSLQTPSTLAALAALTGKFLKKKEGELLKKSYLFYRELETALQELTGQHTSVILTASPLVDSLEKRVSPSSKLPAGNLLTTLRETREEVRALYERVVHH